MPFAKEAQIQAVRIDDWFAARNGNASTVEEKNVIVTESSGFASETTSKYHQSKTDPLIESSLGASKLSRVLVSRVDVVVSISNTALLDPLCTSLGIW